MIRDEALKRGLLSGCDLLSEFWSGSCLTYQCYGTTVRPEMAVRRTSKAFDLFLSCMALVLALSSIWITAERYGLVAIPFPIEIATRAASSTSLPVPLGLGYEAGDQIVEVGDLKFSGSQRSLLVVLSSNCTQCSENLPFYRRVSEAKQASKTGLKIVVVSAIEDIAFASYLKQANLSTDQEIRVQPGTLRVRGVPALILVDGAGRVLGNWEGRIPITRESGILRAIFRSQSSDSTPSRIR